MTHFEKNRETGNILPINPKDSNLGDMDDTNIKLVCKSNVKETQTK